MITTFATLTLAAAASAPAAPCSAAPPLAASVVDPAPVTLGGPTDGQSVQVLAKTLLVGDGTQRENALILIEGGKIKSVSDASALDPDLPLFECDGVLTSGIVVGQTRSGAGGEAFEEARPMMPSAHIAYAFSPEHSDFAKALREGITSLVLAPSAENLVGGLTAVVKSHGGKVVSSEAQLAISFASIALNRGNVGFSFFFGSAEHGTLVPLSADGGPENTSSSTSGARTPTSYAGAVNRLKQLFGAADSADSVQRAKTGKLPVLLEAWDRNEVIRALRFAQDSGLRGALRGAPLAGDAHVLQALKDSGLGVIVGPFAPGQRRRSLEGVAKLMEAGIPVAFALDGPSASPESVRLSAAMAVQAGCDLDRVWAALTGDAARLAGVDGQVGLVAPGHDADLVFWSGHPLDLTSRVESVWVDGAPAHTAQPSK